MIPRPKDASLDAFLTKVRRIRAARSTSLEVNQEGSTDECFCEGASYKSASAFFEVNHTQKTLHITDLYADQKGFGHGSGLLNCLKETYSDYIITLTAIPTLYSAIDAFDPLEDVEDDLLYSLSAAGWDLRTGEYFGNPLGRDVRSEKIVKKLAQRYSDFCEDPQSRLFDFYVKNHFEPDWYTDFISRPKHILRDLSDK